MRRGLLPFGLTVAAFTWCVAAAMTLLAYGAWLLAIAPAVGVVLCGVAWAGLHAACDRGSRKGMRVANAAAWGLAGIGILGALYGGLYVVPALVLLALAAARIPLDAR